MDEKRSPISFLEKDGKVYLSCESTDLFLKSQAEEIRNRYLGPDGTSGLSKEVVLGILTGLKLASELIERAHTISSIEGLLGNNPENPQIDL